VKEWTTLDGRPVPGRVGAVWQLPEGPLPYITGRFTHLTFNQPPRF
jgi:hypothetical protein